MCRSRLWLLYWVSTHIFLIPPLARFDSAKSISRYSPPNGTAGLARSAVSGLSRVPAPPASTIPRTDGCVMTGPPRDTCDSRAMLPRIGRNREELALLLYFIFRPRLPGWGQGGDPPQFPDQHLQGAGGRDGQQRRDETAEQAVDQAAERGPDQDRHQHEQRADPYGLAHDHRVQDVVLDLGIDEEDHRGGDARGTG